MEQTTLERFDHTPRPVPWTLLPGLYFGGIGKQAAWLFVWFVMRNVWAPLGVMGELISLAVLAVGLTLVGVSLRRGRRRHRLLSHGRLITAEVVQRYERKRHPDASSSDGEYIPIGGRYEVLIRYTDAHGEEYESEFRTSRGDDFYDGKQVLALYDPDDPEFCIGLDALAGPPKIDLTGHLINTRPYVTLPWALIPLLVLSSEVLIIFLRYLV